jgi:hypothetical protein
LRKWQSGVRDNARIQIKYPQIRTSLAAMRRPNNLEPLRGHRTPRFRDTLYRRVLSAATLCFAPTREYGCGVGSETKVSRNRLKYAPKRSLACERYVNCVRDYFRSLRTAARISWPIRSIRLFSQSSPCRYNIQEFRGFLVGAERFELSTPSPPVRGRPITRPNETGRRSKEIAFQILMKLHMLCFVIIAG